MSRLLFILIVFVHLSSPARAADDCPAEGTQRGVSGKIASVMQFSDYWMVSTEEMLLIASDCILMDIQGDGQIPAGCREGASFSASGRIAYSLMTDEGYAGLWAESMSCF
ncbi:MAG: hypothetical protein A2516_01890 [Alphaproteobacteria bacterium RIFOXYD12_FULL_60_8]|nr:MAG: hypothetical protein A2516_01890 [Alphaproteobacteria bacterium RIFOXYD12_FULL_60_8]